MHNEFESHGREQDCHGDASALRKLVVWYPMDSDSGRDNAEHNAYDVYKVEFWVSSNPDIPVHPTRFFTVIIFILNGCFVVIQTPAVIWKLSPRFPERPREILGQGEVFRIRNEITITVKVYGENLQISQPPVSQPVSQPPGGEVSSRACQKVNNTCKEDYLPVEWKLF